MKDQYFGTKELYEVVLKANAPMNFGSRKVEVGEPILYFEKVNMAILNEQSRPIMVRGGWGNMPHVIWEDRSEMTFSLSEGVMSSIGMGILTSATMTKHEKDGNLYVQKRETFDSLEDLNQSAREKATLEEKKNIPYRFEMFKKPMLNKKIFCYEYDREAIQKKREDFDLAIVNEGEKNEKTFLEIPYSGQESGNFLVDYYFKYGKEALIYLIEKERFNGTFLLEGKFYTKDENDGLNSTNILTMPKVRVVSDINLRLGERADPTVSVFNIIAMPDRAEESENLLMKIVRLDEDIDADI